MQWQIDWRTDLHIQGGPAKVRPTYIFDGNIECIDKIQYVLVIVITVI